MQMERSEKAFSDRVLDVELDTHFSPIQGVDEAPSMLLRDALQHAQSSDPEFATHNYTINLKTAQYFAEDLTDSVLTMDEVSTLHLYTQESPFYKILNARLRDRNRQLLKPFFPLLKILITALQKLPPIDKTVYRGVKKNLLSKYQEKTGKKEIWWGFSSTTVSLAVLQNEMFLGKVGDRSMFIISAVSLRDISRYSAVPGEKELLLLPGTVFIVDSVLDSNLAVVQLKEHDSLLCLSTALPLKQTTVPVDPNEKPKRENHVYISKEKGKFEKDYKEKDYKEKDYKEKYEKDFKEKYEKDKGKYEREEKFEKDKDTRKHHYPSPSSGKNYEKHEKHEKDKEDKDAKKHHYPSPSSGKNYEKHEKKPDKPAGYEKYSKKPPSNAPRVIKVKEFDL